MKKIVIPIYIIAILLFYSLAGCNSYHSLSSANSIAGLGGNPFMQKVAKSVLSNLGNTMLQNGVNNFARDLNLNGKVSSLLSTPQALTGVKNMLSTKYNIPSSSVESNFGSFSKVKDIVGFVAKNGSGF
jgi:hypothetical protein